MKKYLIITATLSICATLSAMEKPETRRPKGPGKKVINLHKLGELNTQTSTRESKLPKGPEKRFTTLETIQTSVGSWVVKAKL